MRIVADTNIVVSAFLWGGAPKALLAAAREQRITLYTSAALVAELEEVLSRAKLARRFAAVGSTPAALLERYLALTRFVIPAPLVKAISRDPDDDHVIAAALAAQADFIVSGDRDLTDLGQHAGIRFVRVDTAIAMLQ